MEENRISRDQMFMRIAQTVALRGTCPRARVGAVLVKDNRVISIGYNSSLPGQPHCDDVGCEIVGGHCIRTVHAELGAVLWAARKGVSVEEATLYLTVSPCITCAKALIMAGVKRVVYEKSYINTEGLEILYRARTGIKVEKYNETR